MYPPGITKVLPVKDLGATPAKCYRSTGVVLINEDVFPQLPIDYQDFIIAHEAGHIVNNTSNEFTADDFATDWCISQGMKLTHCLFAMTKVLSFPDNKPKQKAEQTARVNRQFQRLLDYDYNVNKNEKAKTMNGERISDEEYFGSYTDSFLGFGKAAKAKKMARAELIKDKGQSKVLEAQAKLELAKQGIASGLGAIGQGIGNMGKSGGAPSEVDEPKKLLGMPQTTGIIVLVGLFLIIVTVLYIFLKKKKIA